MNDLDMFLLIMRGCPGSGKSTLSKQLALEFNALIFSTDQYFHENMDETKPYTFDVKKLGFFHRKNYHRATDAMQKGLNMVIDNTNVSPAEAEDYVRAAMGYGYKVRVFEPNTPWKRDAVQLAERNTHQVPLATIERMLRRWVSHEQFIRHFVEKFPGLDIA